MESQRFISIDLIFFNKPIGNYMHIIKNECLLEMNPEGSIRRGGYRIEHQIYIRPHRSRITKL
jgi:hypothetical protein